MRRLGGMASFVEKGWAGKDYTHIGYGGGRQVARELYHALLWDVHRRQEYRLRQEELRQPVVKNLEMEIHCSKVEIDSVALSVENYEHVETGSLQTK